MHDSAVPLLWMLGFTTTHALMSTSTSHHNGQQDAFAFCKVALGYLFRFQVKICHDQQVHFWGFCYEWIEFVCEDVLHVHVVFSTRLSRGLHASGIPDRLISSLAGTSCLRISVFPSGRTAWAGGSPDPGTSQDCWESPVHLWDYAPIRCLNTHQVLAL